MTRKKKLFFAGVFLCLAALAWGYYLYQKPRAGVTAEQSDSKLTADTLYSHYAVNEEKANQLYSNKVLEVTGVVAQVQNAAGAAAVLLAAKSEMGGGINCSLASDQKADDLKVGQKVCIKGRCTGYLMDVNLVDAVLVNEN
ncbi:tRNA_anti-like [Filimonas lacunae]|uniref:tRNA_anti-like n=1 Tax=Filimonas lacunae TaxID=477680 RepID=A0A173MRU7_9BACT|nr:hypothetical protein [Filimonas lacunae]BAV10374.1 hypothetical protein FLA_6436 [Filimonas lacunae]SIT16517.1 tRNA_anti-like [Filimonas lacunae]